MKRRSISGLLVFLIAIISAAENLKLLFDTSDHGDPGDRAPIIQPWKQITLDPEYSGEWIVSGDVNGDGAVDIVSARNVDQNDVHYTSAVVAQDLNGRVLWRWGNPEIGRRGLHHDVACQIHDWDGDGKNEVILLADGELVELEGATGMVRRTIPIPHAASDCVVFADLTGKGLKTEVLVKTRYTRIWAYNAKGELLWTIENPGGYRTAHQPVPIDIDGDGRDEIMAGYALLNPDGSIRWTYQSETVDLSRGHLDCCRVLQSGKTPDAFRLVLTCCGADNIAVVDGNGKTIWEVSGHHFESVQVGKIVLELPGNQILVDIDHRPKGESPIWVLDADGHQLGQLMSDYCRHHHLLDWTGDGLMEITIAYACGLFDRRGQRIATFAMEGPANMVQVGDMTGDGIHDLLLADSSIVSIFKNEKGKKLKGNIPLGCGVNFTYY